MFFTFLKAQMLDHHLLNGLFSHGGREKYPLAALNWVLVVPNLIHTCIHTYIHTHIHTYIHTYTHTYIHTYSSTIDTYGRRVSIVGGQLSVPSRCTAVYTWLLTASVTSGHGDPALLSWVDPGLGNLGLPLLVGLGSTVTVRCWQTCPELAKFNRQASLGTGCCALP